MSEATRLPRRVHEARVLEQLRLRGGMTRAQLCDVAALSRTTISGIVGDLLATGQVVTAKVVPTQLGRTPEVLELNPEAGLILGVEFGHTRVSVVACDLGHHPQESAVQSYHRSTTWERRMGIAEELIARVRGTQPATLIAIGIGVPGSIAFRQRIVDVVAQQFAQRYAVPVRLGNNARLAGLAESQWGAAKGHANAVYVRLSSGVGGAIILGNRLFQGDSYVAGEFGHVSLDPAGPRCKCSNLGCLEAYVGVETVLANAGQPSIEALVEALDRSEPQAIRVIVDAGARIGFVLANACNILDLASVVIGGDLARTGEHLMRAVRQSLVRQLLSDSVDRLQLTLASLGELDGALGGVALILQDPTVSLNLPLHTSRKGSA